MAKYFVQSGPLKVVVVADDAHDAALESLAWWGERRPDDGETAHRNRLAEEVWVNTHGFNRFDGERFATFNLLARLRRQTPDSAWERLLEQTGSHN